ncbi:DUF2076 domain-containing protein [Coxiella endosymbiont of Ornithodoros amblus]|uniref:DUF2076 domain-containing protein n=1 Tax=Coxiella endosymbiont of Ornithodoros amblus TaxID=1656166 RepID=UPI00244D9C88|nr:DUF2076 domain-containing protein [Coxiella endosymbiont of Ornithodoros amblus]MBW5802593.1 DUF2076 domain-containing protein [Coxiella endosymbiont of Ornithodoros amblus]
MNQNDQQLITQLAKRLKKAQPVAKDSEAAELITQVIDSQPDVVYLLTQAVLLQEAAIGRLQQQVAELQAKVHSKKGFFSSLLGGTRQSNANEPAPYARTNPFGKSSFLGSAMSTVAGVAGGLFLFEGLSHLFSNHSTLNSDTMLNNAGVSDILESDPLQGQGQLLDEGFGTGDSFMDESSFGLDSSDFDDGFGSSTDW